MRSRKFFLAMTGILAALAMTLVPPVGAGTAGKYKLLHVFSGKDGQAPFAGLIFDSAGNLYGTTSSGGASGDGNVFKLRPNSDGTWTESVLHSFDGGDGQSPMGALIFDAAGSLYGTTVRDGAEGAGNVFKLTANADGTWTESELYSFAVNGPGGDGPHAGVIFDSAGNLYGTTSLGGTGFEGTAFKLTPNPDGSWTENVLHSFGAGFDGGDIEGGLVSDTAGNLYGTTLLGGSTPNGCSLGCGVVFKLTPNPDGSWGFSVPYSFTDERRAAHPNSGLVFDKAGNLYGTASGGGPVDGGVVFQLAPQADGTWKYRALHIFEGQPALDPSRGRGLIFDKAGNLYGTTEQGGPANGGVVFQLAPQPDGTWKYRVLHLFQGNPALRPIGGLLLDKAGNFYGTALECAAGIGCAGVVYEITP